eukprot:7687083-Pyramimonas_sp.AAC.2
MAGDSFGDEFDDDGLLANIDLDQIVGQHYQQRAPTTAFTTASGLLKSHTTQGPKPSAGPPQSTVSPSPPRILVSLMHL